MKHSFLTFLFFWSLIVSSISGQNKKFTKITNKKIDSVLKNCNDSIKELFCYKYSLQLYREGKYSEAIKYSKIELELQEKKPKNKKYSITLFKIGSLYYSLDSFPKSLETHKKTINLFHLNPVKAGESYCEIGRIYNRLGLLEEAIQYYQKGFNILKEQKEYKRLIPNYVNFSDVAKKFNNKDKLLLALKYLKEGEKILKKYKNNSRTYYINNQISLMYSHDSLYNFENAKKYLFKNLNSNLDPKKLTTTYNNLSWLYLKEKKDSAIYFINKGLNIVQTRITKARLYDNLSDYYFIKNDYHKALKFIHSSLETNLDNTFNTDQIPSNQDLYNSTYKSHVLHCLHRKIDLLIQLYKKQKNSDYLNQVILNTQAIDNLITLILNDPNYFNSNTKLFWRQKTSEAYLKGAYAASLLKNDSLVSFFIEKNKAILLIENVLDNNSIAKLPKPIIQKIQFLTKKTLNFEDQIKEQSLANQKILKDSLFTTKLTLKKYKDSLRAIYPFHFSKNLGYKIQSLTSIQKRMNLKDLHISFIWDKSFNNEEAIIVLFTTKKKHYSFSITDLHFRKFKEQLSTYKKLVSKPLSTKQELDSFYKTSHELYLKIFPTEVFRKIALKKNITIIPDNELSHIPFESLVIDLEKHTYLIEKSNLSYSYSNSFNFYNDQLKRKTEQDFNGFAPVNFPVSKKVSLNNTKKEITTINGIVNGHSFLLEEASKENFIKNSSNAKIIHLATHATGNKKNPLVYFYDDKMSLNEIYSYKNNADLVVLSACETNLGKIQQGEGVFSLARGFFFSGTKSVISSLWNVNDKASTTIMVDFYKNLKDTQSKSEALNNAKRNYLKNHSLTERSPYYWASFVLIGDSSPTFNKSLWLYFSIGLIFFLLLFYFYLKKRVTKK